MMLLFRWWWSCQEMIMHLFCHTYTLKKGNKIMWCAFHRPCLKSNSGRFTPLSSAGNPRGRLQFIKNSKRRARLKILALYIDWMICVKTFQRPMIQIRIHMVIMLSVIVNSTGTWTDYWYNLIKMMIAPLAHQNKEHWDHHLAFQQWIQSRFHKIVWEYKKSWPLCGRK